MSNIQRTAIMPYSASQMYNLVCDINAYKDFLPWCADSKILKEIKNKNAKNNGPEHIVEAKLWVKKGLIETDFTTRNTLIENISLKMELLDGPFEFLDGHWEFIALNENACKIELKLSYRFANTAFSIALKPIFTQIGNKMLDAFCTRAKEVY
jgi:ribosome-associated toxin RatA of RatAB toxin-antitoxin module